MSFSTADLCDAHHADLQVAEPVFRDFGGVRAFAGAIVTVHVHDDNVLVRHALNHPGEGRVLVVDGEGSLRCALLGDQLAQMAVDHGWAGVVIHGCVRDSARLARMPLGVKALAACPMKSGKEGKGRHNVALRFGGATFEPGAWVYADEDGLLVAARKLELQAPPHGA
jgi:regulator of ribonuclease activity A